MSSPLQAITTKDAPSFDLPFSQGTKAGNLIWTSGSVGVDLETKQLPTSGGIEAQAINALTHMINVVKAGGGSLETITKVYLQDMNDFAAMNKVYSEIFGAHKPARTAVQVAKLPIGALVEFECTAITL